MSNSQARVAGLVALVLAGYAAALWAASAFAKASADKPAGGEVTLIANVLSNVHTGEKEKAVFLLAYDGTPEVKAEFAKILADFYPEKGLDADAAVKLQDQFMTRLRYNVDGPLVEKMWKEAEWTVRGAKAVTGTVSTRDGKRWITATAWKDAAFAFPARVMAPDKARGRPTSRRWSLRRATRCP